MSTMHLPTGKLVPFHSIPDGPVDTEVIKGYKVDVSIYDYSADV